VSRERTDFATLAGNRGAGFVVRLVGGLGRVERGFLEDARRRLQGEVSHAGLPAALAGVDAFVLPYEINGLTRGISPAKTYECLATANPSWRRPSRRWRSSPGTCTSRAGRRTTWRLCSSLGETRDGEGVRARIELARKNSWDVPVRRVGRSPVARCVKTLRAG
jgi:hypothetical protein